MAAFQFTLIIDGPDLQEDDRIDALYHAGCDDAAVGCVSGVQYLDFDRGGTSLEEAVLSAIADVETVPGLEVVRLAGAGMVSMADIAARTGRSRESVRLLISGDRGPGEFPPPVTDPRGRYRLWHWPEVERWLATYTGDAAGSMDERVGAAINAGLELRRHGRHVSPRGRANLGRLVGFLDAGEPEDPERPGGSFGG